MKRHEIKRMSWKTTQGEKRKTAFTAGLKEEERRNKGFNGEIHKEMLHLLMTRPTHGTPTEISLLVAREIKILINNWMNFHTLSSHMLHSVNAQLILNKETFKYFQLRPVKYFYIWIFHNQHSA